MARILFFLIVASYTLQAAESNTSFLELHHTEGELKVQTPEAGKLIIAGDYKQTGGTLVSRVFKVFENTILHNIEVFIYDGCPRLDPPKNGQNFESYKTDSIRPDSRFICDCVLVNGKALLGGEFALKLQDDAIIKEGSSFTILQAEQIEGRFDSIKKWEGVLQPELVYSTTAVEARLVAGKFTDIITNEALKEAANILDRARIDEHQKNVWASLFMKLDLLDVENLEKFINIMVIPSKAFKNFKRKLEQN